MAFVAIDFFTSCPCYSLHAGPCSVPVGQPLDGAHGQRQIPSRHDAFAQVAAPPPRVPVGKLLGGASAQCGPMVPIQYQVPIEPVHCDVCWCDEGHRFQQVVVQRLLPQLQVSKPQMLMLMRVGEGLDRVWWLSITYCNFMNIFGRL